MRRQMRCIIISNHTAANFEITDLKKLKFFFNQINRRPSNPDPLIEKVPAHTTVFIVFQDHSPC